MPRQQPIPVPKSIAAPKPATSKASEAPKPVASPISVAPSSKPAVPKAAPSGPRVRETPKPAVIDHKRDPESESRVVAIRSLQPTLPGIGEVELATLEPVSAAPAPVSARSAEPTMIEELDADCLVDERSGTLLDPLEAPRAHALGAAPPVQRDSRPTPPIPLLRMVSPATPEIHVSRASDPIAPPVSHAPPPPPSVAPSAPPVAPVSQFAPVAAPVAQVAIPPAPAAPVFPTAPVMTINVPAAATPVAAAPRPSLSDPMDVLFDAAYDLCFLQTAVEGATHCMQSAMRALGARGALVHLLDVHTNQFVTVAAHGGDADQQILQRHDDDDWLMSAAIIKTKPLTMDYEGEVSSRPMPRHAAFPYLRNVVVVPVIGWGRPLAVIEIVDADEAFLAGGRGENALAYLAERFAEFLGEREIIVGGAVPQAL